MGQKILPSSREIKSLRLGCIGLFYYKFDVSDTERGDLGNFPSASSIPHTVLACWRSPAGSPVVFLQPGTWAQ